MNTDAARASDQHTQQTSTSRRHAPPAWSAALALVRNTRCSLKCLLTALLAASAAIGCGSAPQATAQAASPAEQRMVAKFGNSGYRLIVDAVKGEEFLGVNFYHVGRPGRFYGSGSQSLRSRSGMDKAGPVPEQARIVWRDSAEHGAETINGSTYSGKIIGNEIIDVGTRIPQEVIDELKRDPKRRLRVKVRMSSQGTLLGWDIERLPGVDRPRGAGGETYTMAGGDFREAEIVNGKVVRPGWYIDRKTGRRIETDH